MSSTLSDSALDLSDSNSYKILLERELSLDSSDLRSHAWYHGNISRVNAEGLVSQEGDFLVRDSTTKPGEYVLTCIWKGNILHILINKQLLQPFAPGFPEKIEFLFESEGFDTISGLITYSVGNQRPISSTSGAIISRPVNRLHPLSLQTPVSRVQLPNGETKLTRSDSKCSFDSFRYEKSIMRIHKPASNGGGSSHGERESESSRFSGLSCISSFSDESSSNWAGKRGEPFYVNWEAAKNNKSSNLSDDAAYFSDYSDKDNWISEYMQSNSFCISRYNPLTFRTFLIPEMNRALDGRALTKIKDTLQNTGSRVLASHIVKADLELIHHTNDKCPENLGHDVESGLELLLLPQGAAFREDFLDRFQCFQYFIETSILTCQAEKDRALIMDKWIQIAIECKACFGDLMAFATVMNALCSANVIRLKRTWSSLRQNYTENTLLLERKLKSVYKSLKECKEPSPPNTTFPYILPSVQIIHQYQVLRKKIDVCNGDDISLKLRDCKLDLDIENYGNDYGLNVIFSHLDSHREIANQLHLYKRNGGITLRDFVFDDLLSDMFRMGFHRRFLWGAKGCNVSDCQRYEKFEKLLDLLSKKCEAD